MKYRSMNFPIHLKVGVLLFLFVFLAIPHDEAFAQVTCGWEGNRYCIYGESESNLQNSQVTLQCTTNCYGGTTPTSTSLMSSNPTVAQNGTGVCVPFLPPRSDIDAMIAAMVEQTEAGDLCRRRDNEELIFNNSTGQFGFLNTSTGVFTPFVDRDSCLAIIIGTASTYRISIGSQCSATQTISLTENGQVVGDPWVPDPEDDGMEPGEVITTIEITPDHRPEDTPISTSLEYCRGRTGIETAIGCISINPRILVEFLVNAGIGIGGGIAFLIILFGAFRVMISRGNPEHMEAGKDMVSSAVAGLFLIIFSVFILRFIGFDVLNIPGFGG